MNTCKACRYGGPFPLPERAVSLISEIITILTSPTIVQDFLRILAGTAVFPAIIVPPGYVLAYLLNLSKFRTRPEVFRIQIAILLSVSVSPTITYLAAKSCGMICADLFFFLSAAAYLTLIAGGASKPWELVRRIPERRYGLALCMIVVFFVAVASMLVDIEIHGRLIRNFMNHDYVKHVAVTDAISRTGVPPVNPNLYPGRPLQLFYYYLWFLLCSFVDRYGRSAVDARAAVHGSIVWCGLALLALANVFLKHYGDRIVKGLTPSQHRIGCMLLLVGGLDIIAVVIIGVTKAFPMSIDWWNEQVTAWIGAVLWVPHHVGAFIASMVAFLVLSEMMKPLSIARRTALQVVAALCLASAVGMSIWVGFTAAVILAVWLVVTTLQKRLSETTDLIVIGVVSTLLLIPYIIELGSSGDLQQAPLKLYVRTFGPLHRALAEAGLNNILLTRLLDLLVLPLNYALELGVFLAGTLYYMKCRRLREPLNRDESFMITMTVTSVLVCTFLSANIVNNDLGARGFMFAQFGMLLWSIPLVSELIGRSWSSSYPLYTSSRKRFVVLGLVGSMLVLGAAGNIYDLCSMRLRFLGPHGKPSLVFRKTCEWVAVNVARTAVVQLNPQTDIEYFLALYGNRQSACSDLLYGQLYGVSPRVFQATIDSIAPLFEHDIDISEVVERCGAFGITHLVYTVNDPLWEDSLAWIWRQTPMNDQGLTRVFAVASLSKPRR